MIAMHHAAWYSTDTFLTNDHFILFYSIITRTWRLLNTAGEHEKLSWSNHRGTSVSRRAAGVGVETLSDGPPRKAGGLPPWL